MIKGKSTMKFIPDTDEQGTGSRIQHPKQDEKFSTTNLPT